MAKEKLLKNGQRVLLANQGDTVYEVESSEMHNQRRFYRLLGLEGALFLRQSLLKTRRKALKETP